MLGHGGLLAHGMDYRFPPYGEGVRKYIASQLKA